MELVKSGKSDYEEYEALLLERDQVRKEAGQIWTEYMCRFGQLIRDVYDEEVQCIKCKKTISYYQKALNHGGTIDRDAMQKWLDQEMEAYDEKLKEIEADYNTCRNAGISSEYEVRRSRTLYRRLAKLIHPDINPETDHNEKLQELWQRIVTAYHRNDVKELSELEVLVQRAMEELGQGRIEVDIPDISKKIEELKKEIQDIRNTEPYIYQKLLEYREAGDEKETALQEELKTYQKYHKELEEEIQKMLTTGGIRIQWRMN